MAYDHIAVWLPTYVNEHGELPSYLATLEFLRTVHGLRSSSTTVQRALDGWKLIPANQALLAEAARRRSEQYLPSAAGSGPAMIEAGEGITPSAPPSRSPGIPAADPLLAAALTSLRDSIRSEERQRADAAASEQVAQIRAAADEAVRQAKVSEERATLLLQQTEAHRAAAEAHAAERVREADARVSESRSMLVALQQQHAGERAAERAAATRDALQQVDAAVAPWRETITRLEQRLADAEAREAALHGRLAAVTDQLLTAERNAAAQYSEITRHWAGELSRIRDETTHAQTALRKAVAEKDDAVRAARAEATDAVVLALNNLREAVGGVNAVHNTHLGGITKRLADLETLARALARGRENTGGAEKSRNRAIERKR